MDYTITSQYHEKKGIEIFVVRLSDKVGKDTFTTLSDLAKNHKGYYSSFRGVNGFVFKTKERAEEFCADMTERWDTTEVTDELPQSKKPKQERKPLNPPSENVELHKALRHIIQTEGESIITEARLVNILDDFKAYSNMPTAKYILRAIIADGFAQKLLSIGEWNNDAINLSSRFAATTGFMPETVIILFKAIAYGVGWINKWESSLKSTASIPKPQPLPVPKPTGPRSNGWTKKMDEDQTDDFFQALTEYDKFSEKEFQVKLENLYYTVEDSNLCFSLEISYSFKDNRTVSLYYAIYNLKGKIIDYSFVEYVDKRSVNPKPTAQSTWKKASNIGKIRFYWQ